MDQQLSPLAKSWIDVLEKFGKPIATSQEKQETLPTQKYVQTYETAHSDAPHWSHEEGN